MLERIITLLLESYRQDLEDYDELMLKMQEFNILLEENEKNKKKEKSPIQNLASRLDESFEQSLQGFCGYREKTFKNLQQRADREKNIQLQACSEIGIDIFEIVSFDKYISENLSKELTFVIDSLRTKMAYILELDNDILQKLTEQLNELRLEIHRIEGVKKTRNAYGNKPYKDSLYIDRTK